MSKKKLQMILLAGLPLSLTFCLLTSWWWEFHPFFLIWPALSLHQNEEYFFTERVLGKDYFLLNWMDREGFDLTPQQVFRMDVLLGWTSALTVGLLGHSLPWAGLFMILFLTWNGMWHIMAGSHRSHWSPGTVTSLLAYLPLCGWISLMLLEQGIISRAFLFAIVLLTCLCHHIFLSQFPRNSKDQSTQVDE